MTCPCFEYGPDRRPGEPHVIGLAAKIAVGASLSTSDRAMLGIPVGASSLPARIGMSDVRCIEAMIRALVAQDKAGTILATTGQFNSLRTARDLPALGDQIRQYTTDSTALDLALRIRTQTVA
ncbi:MAG: hypothetical protein ABR608_08125 [Pseudonocardiaceae bacterium]